MRKYAGLAVLVLLLQSCAIGPRLVTEYDADTHGSNPLNQKVFWTYAWGIVQPKDFRPPCNPNFNHLNKVEVRTNIGFIMLSAATLGIVVPVQVKWACAPQPVVPGDLGVNR